MEENSYPTSCPDDAIVWKERWFEVIWGECQVEDESEAWEPVAIWLGCTYLSTLLHSSSSTTIASKFIMPILVCNAHLEHYQRLEMQEQELDKRKQRKPWKKSLEFKCIRKMCGTFVCDGSMVMGHLLSCLWHKSWVDFSNRQLAAHRIDY